VLLVSLLLLTSLLLLVSLMFLLRIMFQLPLLLLVASAGVSFPYAAVVISCAGAGIPTDAFILPAVDLP